MFFLHILCYIEGLKGYVLIGRLVDSKFYVTGDGDISNITFLI